MATNKRSRIAFEDVRLGFRNFSGKEGKFNPAGRRNFCIFIPPERLEDILEDGWNVKFLKPRDENEEPVPYIQVAVNFDNYPPQIILISSSGKTFLDEESVDILDWAEIECADVIVTGYDWEVNGSSGRKAYLKAIYVTLVEDEFASKYANVPDSAATAIMTEE